MHIKVRTLINKVCKRTHLNKLSSQIDLHFPTAQDISCSLPIHTGTNGEPTTNRPHLSFSFFIWDFEHETWSAYWW